ncbi:MAG TPA: hypothetical protein VGJ08_12990 [Rhizomicrobium sp.]|jgi:hypothetical protein
MAHEHIAEIKGTEGSDGIDGYGAMPLIVALDGIASVEMAEPQKQKLKDLLTRVRRESFEEGYSKGYDAALRDAESLAEERQGDVGMTVVMAPGAGKSGAAARLAKGFKPRLTPGLADKLVREALEKVAPREVTATEILHTIKNDLGTIMGFSTMRRSLTRLNQIGHAAYDADTQLWSLATKGSANTKLRSIKG